MALLRRDVTNAYLTICGCCGQGRARRASVLHYPQVPGSLFQAENDVREIQVPGTYRQGDGVPRPSPDSRLH
jgi:hypothetical protein